MKEELLEILKEVNNKLANENINYIDSGLLDSMSIFDLIVKIEDKIKIEIEPEDIIPENFISFDSVFELVKKYKQQ